MSDDDEWFAPKRIGAGPGLPISWQGWALLVGFVVLIGLATPLAHYSLIAFLSVVTMLTTAFVVIAARKTRGGWRWHNGEDDG
jgi:uncharacterized membrane protein YphA (DoxX/SURF4 family)